MYVHAQVTNIELGGETRAGTHRLRGLATRDRGGQPQGPAEREQAERGARPAEPGEAAVRVVAGRPAHPQYYEGVRAEQAATGRAEGPARPAQAGPRGDREGPVQGDGVQVHGVRGTQPDGHVALQPFRLVQPVRADAERMSVLSDAHH